MKIQGSDIIIQHDPLSYATGYALLQGSPHQTYDPQAMVYDPSRANVPLVILPWVSKTDPNGPHSGPCTLHSVSAIYRKLVNGNWVDTVIDGEDSSKYYISDGTTREGVTAPAGAVVCFENVAPTEAVSIIITANVVDDVDGLLKSFDNTVELVTKTATTVTYKLRADDGFPVSMSIDPRDIEKNQQGQRLLTLAVQLYGDGVAVADANAVYFWYLWNGSSYERITDENQLWLRTAFLNANTHELPNTIQVDLDYFDQIRLMVSASPIGDTVPTEPDFLHGAEKIYFDYKRACRKDVEGFVFGGVGIKLTGDERIERYVQLRDKSGDLTTAEMDEHFRFDWFLRNGNTNTLKSRGQKVTGKAKTDFKATVNNVTNLTPKTYFMKCWKPIVFNGSYLVEGGRVVCGQDYIEI